MSDDASRIVQIMPAHGLVLWLLEDGVLIHRPLTAFGLQMDGLVIPLFCSEEGEMSDPSDTLEWHGFVAIIPDGFGRPDEKQIAYARDRLARWEAVGR